MIYKDILKEKLVNSGKIFKWSKIEIGINALKFKEEKIPVTVTTTIHKNPVVIPLKLLDQAIKITENSDIKKSNLTNEILFEGKTKINSINQLSPVRIIPLEKEQNCIIQEKDLQILEISSDKSLASINIKSLKEDNSHLLLKNDYQTVEKSNTNISDKSFSSSVNIKYLEEDKNNNILEKEFKTVEKPKKSNTENIENDCNTIITKQRIKSSMIINRLKFEKNNHIESKEEYGKCKTKEIYNDLFCRLTLIRQKISRDEGKDTIEILSDESLEKLTKDMIGDAHPLFFKEIEYFKEIYNLKEVYEFALNFDNISLEGLDSISKKNTKYV